MHCAPIWCVLTDNLWDLNLRLENFKVWDQEDEVVLYYLLKELKFWSQQVSHFENWWLNNPKSRVELIVYQPPARIGAAVAL